MTGGAGRWTGRGRKSESRDAVVAPGERPAVGLLPEAAQDRELLLEHLGAHLDGRERQAVVVVLRLVPAGAEATRTRPPDISSTVATILARVPGMAERDRRHQDPEADPLRLAGEAGHHRPRVGRGAPPSPGKLS